MRISDWSSDVCSSDLKTRCDAGTEYAEAEDGQAGEHQAHRLADVGLLALQRPGELGEAVGPYADDHGEHHDLDARRHDIAEHTFSDEAGAVPQRECQPHDAGQGGHLSPIGSASSGDKGWQNV